MLGIVYIEKKDLCMCVEEREAESVPMHVIHIIYYKSLINIVNRFNAALIST